MTASLLNVGFLGAGPATQAIHLPTLATMTERFRVTSVMDVDADLAGIVSRRCGASAQVDERAIIDDPDVDIVAICSPNAFHARQAIAACRAGKKAVLCEKPLAVTREEAAEITEAAQQTGTAIFVGTMHAYDPAVRAALTAWKSLNEEASFVQSSIYLPSNSVFEDQATQRATPKAVQAIPDIPDHVRLRYAMLGLAIHNIPLIRDFYPRVGEVFAADVIAPFGYAIASCSDNQAAEFNALMPGDWPPGWSLRVTGRKHSLAFEFPPSYVLSGSTRVELSGVSSTQVFEAPVSGYEALWHHIADVIHGSEKPHFHLDRIVADLDFAISLADGAERVMGAY